MILQSLLLGEFLGRRQRFFADVQLQSGPVVAHCPNTGSMASLLGSGSLALLSPANNPNRKLAYTLEALRLTDGTWACVNTQRANTQVAEALRSGNLPQFPAGCHVETEVVLHAGTRFDFRIQHPSKGTIWLEVKNVTLAEPTDPLGVVRFPDAVTVRGTKHLRELTELSKNGISTCICYLVNRSDATLFKPAAQRDPSYAKALLEAHNAGVEILVLAVDFHYEESKLSLEIRREIPWSLE